MRVWLVAMLSFVIALPAMAQNAATLAEQVSRIERRVQAMETANLGGTGASAADLEQRMQDLEGESSQINGGVERLGNAVERLAKRVDELAKDFDLRLRDLEAAAHANGTAPGQQVAGPAAATTAPAAVAGEAAEAASPTATTSGTSALVPVTPGLKPADHYNRAYAYLTAADYPNAKAWLEAFLTANPKDPLADNAHYWLGEVNLVQNNPQGAVVAFKNGLAAFPKGQKAPANLLKMGIALQQMKQEQFAKGAWEKLVKDYPRSAEAEKAKAKLAELPKADAAKPAAAPAKEAAPAKPKS